jgi:excinuclease ABC subunit A
MVRSRLRRARLAGSGQVADHVIDLGPEGGHAGGKVVATGTPEVIAATRASHTGRFLKSHLAQ